jgi:hypothetical protein
MCSHIPAYFGNIGKQRRALGVGGNNTGSPGVTILKIGSGSAIDIGGILVKAVEAQLKVDVLQDDQANGNTDRKSENIDKGIQFPLHQVAEGKGQVAF